MVNKAVVQLIINQEFVCYGRMVARLRVSGYEDYNDIDAKG